MPQRTLRWLGRLESAAFLILLVVCTERFASFDARSLFAWLVVGLPVAIAVWAAIQRGFSSRFVLGGSFAVFLLSDLVAMLLRQDACFFTVVFCMIHGAAAVIAARLAERRRLRFYATVRRGLTHFRGLRHARKGPYR